MSDNTPMILQHLRYLNMFDDEEIKAFLHELKDYEEQLLKKLQKKDGKMHGADDLLPALEQELQGFINEGDQKKINEIYEYCCSHELDEAIEAEETDDLKKEKEKISSAGEYIYALVSLNCIANYILQENKHRNAIIVLTESLAHGLVILQKTASLIQKYSQKEPKKYKITLEVLDNAILDLQQLRSDIESKLDNEQLPQNYFKDSFKTFQTIMATARNKVDERSLARKALDNVFHVVSYAFKKAFRILHSFIHGGFFHKQPEHKYKPVSQKEPHEEAINVVEMKVIEDLAEGDVSSSYYEPPIKK